MHSPNNEKAPREFTIAGLAFWEPQVIMKTILDDDSRRTSRRLLLVPKENYYKALKEKMEET